MNAVNDYDYLAPHMLAVHIAIHALNAVDFAALTDFIDHTETCAPVQSPELWADDGPRRITEYRLLVEAAKQLAETADGIRLARMVAP